MRNTLLCSLVAGFLFACAGLPPMVPLQDASPVVGTWEGELVTVKGNAMLRVEIDSDATYRWAAAKKAGEGTLVFTPEGEVRFEAYGQKCTANLYQDETRRYIRVQRIGGGAYSKLLPVR